MHPFPSPRLPVIDLSSLTARAGDHHPQIAALVGIAADGVARIAVQFVHGPEYTIPVITNTYIDRQVPQRRARMVTALDSRGRKLFSVPLPVPRLR
jgi:hypothetical protein